MRAEDTGIMNCPACGTRLDRPGQGHSCRVGPPSVLRLPGLVLSLAVPLTLAVSFAVWTAMTKGVVERYGGTIAVARNGAMTDALIIFGLSYVLPMRIPTTAYLLLRVLAGILLIAGLVMARIKILRWYAEPAEPSAAAPLPQQRTPPELTGTPVPVGLPPVEIQPGDWDAHLWDPDIQADIERRRRRGSTQT